MSRIFIALAAWEPAPALFDRQVESLTAQTLRDWSGVVVDDGSSEAARAAIAGRLEREPRLSFVAGRERLGFYANFGRALALAPADCDYVALCDQDDRWHPGKLEKQVRALDASPEARLCYSDLRLTDPEGEVIAGSFWVKRPHGRSFREVLYNNVVTGATALFRRGLLDRALPLPADPGGAFHDHWLALCAMADGALVYLDEPLVDYTQHGANAIGAQALEHAGRAAAARLAGQALGQVIASPREARAGLDRLAEHGERVEARLGSFAAALQARVPRLAPAAQQALRPFLRPRRAARVLDLAVPTFFGSMAAGQETNLEPLKIAAGLAWRWLRRAA